MVYSFFMFLTSFLRELYAYCEELIVCVDAFQHDDGKLQGGLWLDKCMAGLLGPGYYNTLYEDEDWVDTPSYQWEGVLGTSYEAVMQFFFSSGKDVVDEQEEQDTDEVRMDRFVEKQRTLFDAALQGDVCRVNANLGPVFYDKARFEGQTEAERAALAAAWKSRALLVASPLLSQANVLMYYDTDQLGFAYHSDFVVASPVFLNALAMKYVVQFRCLDFFVDEVVVEDWKSPLLPLHAVEDEKKEEEESKDAAEFQAFVKEHAGAFVQRKKDPENRKVLPAIVVRNHFVYKGKMSDYSFVQKVASSVPVAKKEALFGVRPSLDCLFEDVLGSDVEMVESPSLDYKTFKKRGLLRRLLGR